MNGCRPLRALVVCLLTTVLFAASAAAAQAACNDTWTGSTGDWATAGNWSNGVPTSASDVCITTPGSDVTLGAADTNGGATINSLTLGGTSGSATLNLLGEDFTNGSGEATPNTTLTVSSASTISSSGQLFVDATTGGPLNGGVPLGGNAQLVASSLASAGQIVFEATPGAIANGFGPQLQGELTNAAGGTVTLASGTLMPTGNNPFALTNDGALTVASGATLQLDAGDNGSDRSSLTNNGPVTNSGVIAVNGSDWTQSGGSISPNAVTMQNGSSLIDSAGPGAFLFDNNYGSISGTIPSGQTVTVQGEGGSSGNTTSLELNADGNTAPVTNDGTLILDAPGSGTSSGGAAYLTDGTVDNNGAMISQDEDANWRNDLQASVNNSAGATFSLTGGTMLQEGSTMINGGTVTVAPTALWILDEGGALTNSAAGTLAVQIAGATTYGSFQLNNPCCNAPGAFTAGGTLEPVLEGGYVPLVGQVFPLWAQGGGPFTGTFATVTGGFVGDYGENANPPIAGIIYQPAATAPSAPTKAPTPSAHPRPTVHGVSGRDGKLSVRLTCPAGGGACSAVSIRVTATEYRSHGRLVSVTRRRGTKRKVVTVARGTVTLTASRSKTLTLTLNATGRGLMARFHRLAVRVTVSTGGRRLKAETVIVHRAAVKKGHKKRR